MTTVETVSRPIVVGFDPETLDRAPVHFAVAAARWTGAPLIVACASAPSPILDQLPPAYGDEELAQLNERAFADLEAAICADDLPVEFRELHGTSAARVLYETAHREGARLLVVGSTGRGTVGRVLPGSTAERLMHSAPCAVAVVPHRWASKSLDTIGVAFARTDEGFEALRGAYGLAERAEALLRVLSVVQLHPAMYRSIEPSGRFERGRSLIDVEGASRLELETEMRDAVARIPGLASDVDVQIDAFVGDPAVTLIGVSENLDLLVCGSRGYGPLRAALMGGVSRRVMAGAHCPVMVLARGVDAPLEPLRPAVADSHRGG